MTRLIFLSLTILELCTMSEASIEEYKKLKKSLMTNYSKDIRPVYDQDETVNIYMVFYLSNINELDAVQQRLVTTAHLGISWTDEFLQWDEASTGIEAMYLKQSDIWIPDVVLKNGVNRFEELGGDFYYLEVSSDGTVFWLPNEVFESKCKMEITYFPFDTQVCDITFISWSFTKWEVNVTLYDKNTPVEYYDYVENSVWSIESTSVQDGAPEDDSDATVTFTLHLRRKPLYYVMNLILPVVLLGVISLLVFVIPAEAGEKMSFAMAVFLSFAVFLSIISTQLPVNSEKTSILGEYIVFQMSVGVTTIIISSFQLRLHYRKSEGKIGRFYRGIVKFERCLRCVKSPSKEDSEESLEKGRKSLEPEVDYNDVNWHDVSSAVDFYCFWTILFLELFAVMAFMLSMNVFEYL